MQLSKDAIERIRRASPIERIAAERGIALKRKGRDLVGLCPFHEEKTGSFSISPSKGLFHCFGCGEGGDVFHFVELSEKVEFPEAARLLANRSALDCEGLPGQGGERTAKKRTVRMAVAPRVQVSAAQAVEVVAPANGTSGAATAVPRLPLVTAAEALARVAEHYHRTLLGSELAQAYLRKRGLGDPELWKLFRLGYADGSLLQVVSKDGELREALAELGVVSPDGRELLGGCVVFPLPDPATGAVVNLYGRGVARSRHCYLKGSLRGVLNYQAARSASEVVLTESVIDALSLFQVGISSAVPLFGANGFTDEMLDCLLASASRRVVLCLDNDEAGRRASQTLGAKLRAAGITVRVAELPAGIKDPNELLVSRNGDAAEAFARVLAAVPAAPSPTTAPAAATAPEPPASEEPAEARPSAPPAAPNVTAAASGEREASADGMLVRFPLRTYHAKSQGLQASDRLTVVVRVEDHERRFHYDIVNLYAARSRREFARRVAVKLSLRGFEPIEEELLHLIAHLEAARQDKKKEAAEPAVPVMTEAERAEAMALLMRPDLLEQVRRDADALGFVGERINVVLAYLVASSRKLPEPCSAIILSQSGAGKSGLATVLERVIPPEEVMLFTRLTPQSLYYLPPGMLDRKLVIIEERAGSEAADYGIRVLQSRGLLRSGVPVKNPATGDTVTKTYTVEARAAFLEATTDSRTLNFENLTRCFELTMDESAEQTSRIHERQRLMKTEEGFRMRQQAEAICRCHQNAQRLLAAAPVLIPYAGELTFPTQWMRTRRDHARFLNLIEASAFLHQHQRERKDGAIVAALADYEVAYELAQAVLSDTLSDLKAPVRKAWEAVRTLIEGEGGAVSRREVREALQQPDTNVRRFLAELVDLEYLQVDEGGGRGKTVRYALAERGPREGPILGLLSPQDLSARIGR